MHRVCLPRLVEAARVSCVDRFGQLAVQVEQQIDEMAARLEQRPVRHGRAPRHGLLPRRQVHELRDLAEDEAADAGLADLLLDRAEDRLRPVLVVDGDSKSRGISRGEDAIGLLDRGDERLLADDVGAALQRRDRELGVRRRRGADDHQLRLRRAQQLFDRRERRRFGRLRPPRAALLGRVGAADDLDAVNGAQGGEVKLPGRPAEADDCSSHRQSLAGAQTRIVRPEHA